MQPVMHSYTDDCCGRVREGVSGAFFFFEKEKSCDEHGPDSRPTQETPDVENSKQVAHARRTSELPPRGLRHQAQDRQGEGGQEAQSQGALRHPRG